MIENWQNSIVYLLFGIAILYFAYRFYLKNFKRKTNKNGKSCGSNGCGCS